MAFLWFLLIKRGNEKKTHSLSNELMSLSTQRHFSSRLWIWVLPFGRCPWRSTIEKRQALHASWDCPSGKRCPYDCYATVIPRLMAQALNYVKKTEAWYSVLLWRRCDCNTTLEDNLGRLDEVFTRMKQTHTCKPSKREILSASKKNIWVAWWVVTESDLIMRQPKQCWQKSNEIDTQ